MIKGQKFIKLEVKIMKPSKEELEEAYIARLKSETRPPRTEADRKIGEERMKEIDEYIKKYLSN